MNSIESHDSTFKKKTGILLFAAVQAVSPSIYGLSRETPDNLKDSLKCIFNTGNTVRGYSYSSGSDTSTFQSEILYNAANYKVRLMADKTSLHIYPYDLSISVSIKDRTIVYEDFGADGLVDSVYEKIDNGNIKDDPFNKEKVNNIFNNDNEKNPKNSRIIQHNFDKIIHEIYKAGQENPC